MKYMYVYILTNKNNTTFYVGVTNNLVRRVWEHKNKIHNGFTARYNLDKLIYFETYDDELIAIDREKKLKDRSRQYKIDLVKSVNSSFSDLYDTL